MGSEMCIRDRRYLDDATLEAAQSFGLDNQPRNLPASTLDHPYVVDDLRRGYRQNTSGVLKALVACTTILPPGASILCAME